ncbi:MAG: DUF4345 domain-containing protein [Pseudomonadota bacterium]
MRRTFQITLLCAAFIPFLLGAMSLVQGAERLVPADLVDARLDGQVRFWGIRSMLPFGLALWIVTHLDEAFWVLAMVVGATAAGGLARVWAALVHGAPEPFLIGIIAFEVATLLFLPWYKQINHGTPANKATDGEDGKSIA